MKVTNDWGYDHQRGWWYAVFLDGREVSRGANFDDEKAMLRALRRDVDATKVTAQREAQYKEQYEAQARVVLIVAESDDVAAELCAYVARRLRTTDNVAVTPWPMYADLEPGMRLSGVVLVGLDLKDDEVKSYVQHLVTRLLPNGMRASIGCVNGSFGRDLLHT